MFGWEFPPQHNGGLGVACFGLTRALTAQGTDVVFVMPKKVEGITSDWMKFVFADAEGKQQKGAGSVTFHAIHSIISPYMTSEEYEWAYKEAAASGRRPGMPVGKKSLFEEVVRYAALGGAIAAEEDFDVIYAHDWLTFGAGIEAKRRTGKPLIVHIHATEFDRCGGAGDERIHKIEYEGMQAADAVVAVSQLTKDMVVQRYNIPADKVYVVHNGIDDASDLVNREAITRLHTIKDAGNKIVLFLGRITQQKGPEYFLMAARRVLEHNRNVYFVLTGSGDMDARMKQMAKDLKIDDRVLFTGWISSESERYEMYGAADLFIMPSVSEPFGLVGLEAMIAGTPVIMSKQSGAAEVTKHTLKVDFWDVDEMANKILSVVGYPGLAETLSQNGAHEVKTITWDAAASKVCNVIQRVLDI